MVGNISNPRKHLFKAFGATLIVALLLSCRTTNQISYTKDVESTYRDTTINIPMETYRFDVEDITRDTTISYDDVTLQIVHDTASVAKIYYLKAPQVIKLDSVIKTVTIKEVYRIKTEKQVCNSKFHQFSASFLQWTLSIVLVYVGLKALVN